MPKTNFEKMETRSFLKQIVYLAIGAFGVTTLLNKSFEAGCEYTAGAIGSAVEGGLLSNDKESE